MIKPSHDIILNLIRCAVNPATDLNIPVELNWQDAFEFASRQGVSGLCMDVIPASSMPFNVKMQWIGEVLAFEQNFKKYSIAIEKLTQFYEDNGIRMMILKGYSMSLNWKCPNRRPIGDIDVYLFGDWKKADGLLMQHHGIKINDGYEHHTTFLYKGFMVENHYDIINTRVMSDAAALEKWLKKEAVNAVPYQLGDTIIYLPSAQFNAIFLMRHLGSHFSGSEATLRQVLDWAFFMSKHSGEVDWPAAIKILRDIGLERFFHQINAICVDCLGFREDTFPTIKRDAFLENRILQDILQPKNTIIDGRRSTLYVIWKKTLRFFANSWKRRLVYRDSLLKQFCNGCMMHLKRFKTIKD